uniref:Uncharacterized protein n=1 Tax=Acrobeloides nanus TaxID=290746 RepID=A0A914CMN8_9BILA
MSVASTITLDDIIASARRKISQDYEEPRLPSPVFLDELPSEADKHSWTGMLDIDDGFGEADSFVQHLVDSEDEMWMAEPPTILNDDDQEDFEELLNNPLDRDAKSEKIDLPMRKRHFDRHFDDETSSADLSLVDIEPSQMNSCFTPFPPMLRTQISETRPEYEGNL